MGGARQGGPPRAGEGAETRGRADRRNGRPRERLRRRVFRLSGDATDVGELGDEPVGLGEILLSARVVAREVRAQAGVPGGVEPARLLEGDTGALEELAHRG